MPFPLFSRVGGAWSHGRSHRELTCSKAVLEITKKHDALSNGQEFQGCEEESQEATNFGIRGKTPEASKCAFTYACRSLCTANGRPPVRERSVLTDKLQKQIQLHQVTVFFGEALEIHT